MTNHHVNLENELRASVTFLDLATLLTAPMIVLTLAETIVPSVQSNHRYQNYYKLAMVASTIMVAALIIKQLGHTLLKSHLQPARFHLPRVYTKFYPSVPPGPRYPVRELRHACLGPALGLTLSLFFFIGAALTKDLKYSPSLQVALSILGKLNLIFSAIDLCPTEPFDGGRIVKCTLWMITKKYELASMRSLIFGEEFLTVLRLAGMAGLCFGQATGALTILLLETLGRSASEISWQKLQSKNSSDDQWPNGFCAQSSEDSSTSTPNSKATECNTPMGS